MKQKGENENKWCNNGIIGDGKENGVEWKKTRELVCDRFGILNGLQNLMKDK